MEGLELNGTHKLLLCAEGSFFVESMNTVNKTHRILLGATYGLGPEIKAKQTNLLIFLCVVTGVQNKTTKTAKCFENMAEFEYIGRTLND
jgi:hypothetical protein